MKLVYLKVKDPIAWKASDAEFYEDDFDLLTLNVVRVGGILIHEDNEKLSIAEISMAEDNSELAQHGVKYPQFRYVMTVAKVNILERQDFEVKPNKGEPK